MAVVFAWDFLTPRGFAHGFFYLPLALTAIIKLSPRQVLLIVIAAIAAIWLGLAMSPPQPASVPYWHILTNRIAATLTLLVLYGLSRRYTHIFEQERQGRQRADVDRRTIERLTDSLPIKIWIATADGAISFAGSRFHEFRGASKDGDEKGWFGMVHPEDRGKVMAHWWHATSTGEDYSVECRLRRADGRYVWHLMQAVPERDETGSILRWLGSSSDIDHIRQLREEARVSAERFHLVGKAMNDVLWDWDLAANTLWWSEGFESVFGHERNEFNTGLHTWSSHVHPDDRERVLDSLHEAAAGTDSIWAEEYRFFHADGRLLNIVDRGFVIRAENGRAVRMVGSMRDVTTQRELDERLRQSQKLEAIGQLTGGIAHDFNNLLTIILGNAELLGQRLKERPELKTLADMTATAAARGAELTGRLLIFARQKALQPEPVDINRLAESMDTLLRRTIAAEVAIEIVPADDLWLAEVDAGQLEAALLNLAINARDAMSGPGQLTIRTQNISMPERVRDLCPQLKPGDYVMISVTDTGAGMDAETLSRAFEPFFTTKDPGRGSGLGLSMVYGFAKQSGGHVTIHSEIGVGTTVNLYLPRAASDAGHIGPREEAPAVIGGNERVLVVEDDDLVRAHLTELLTDLGYRVIAVNAPEPAMDILREGAEIDLLFTDVVMAGGSNGRELAQAAAALRPALKVLFTSGYTEDSVIRHGRLEQGVHFLAKPYRYSDLAAKMRAVLDGSQGMTPEMPTA